MTRSKGFTLIELLVVIAIIGLLASIIVASLNTAQQKGRDARRISDLKEVQLALELYYDSNGNYPVQGTQIAAGQVSGPTAATVISAANSAFGLAPNYITQSPIDPSQPSSGASYHYYQYESLNSDGQTACTTAAQCQSYVLVAYLEAAANSSSWTGTNSTWLAVCPSGGGTTSPYSYCVHS